MEYYLSRALEVCRLTDDDLERLHDHEKKNVYLRDMDSSTGEFKTKLTRSVMCLFPFEIQQLFDMGPLKTAYMIPFDEIGQAAYVENLRGQFRTARILNGTIDPTKVDEVHKFDICVRSAVDRMAINLYGKKSDKRKVSENMDVKPA